jgi:hypothetical protein
MIQRDEGAVSLLVFAQLVFFLLVKQLGGRTVREHLEDGFGTAEVGGRIAIHSHHCANCLSGEILQRDGDTSLGAQSREQRIGRKAAAGIRAAEEGFAGGSAAIREQALPANSKDRLAFLSSGDAASIVTRGVELDLNSPMNTPSAWSASLRWLTIVPR